MIKRVLIIHGWGSNSREHWFSGAKERLEGLGSEVMVPDMPNTDYPIQEEWVSVIEDFAPDESSILIGHSLGGTAMLRFLEKASKKVGKCIFIATPIRKIGHKEIDNFFEEDFNWQKIRESAISFLVLNQTKDPWVNSQHGKDLAANLVVDLTLVEGSDHFDKINFLLLERNILDQ